MKGCLDEGIPFSVLRPQRCVTESWTKNLDYLPSFCSLSLMVSTYRHTDSKQSLGVAFPGLVVCSSQHHLSVAFLQPCFPFMVVLEVLQKRNFRPSRVCPLEGDNPYSPANCSRRGTPRESPFVRALVSWICSAMLILPKG